MIEPFFKCVKFFKPLDLLLIRVGDHREVLVRQVGVDPASIVRAIKEVALRWLEAERTRLLAQVNAVATSLHGCSCRRHLLRGHLGRL